MSEFKEYESEVDYSEDMEDGAESNPFESYDREKEQERIMLMEEAEFNKGEDPLAQGVSGVGANSDSEEDSITEDRSLRGQGASIRYWNFFAVLRVGLGALVSRLHNGR
jgi:hypothetical protein